jgi:hypothetical protein
VAASHFMCAFSQSAWVFGAAEQNSCSALFLQNSFPQRLHLTSTFFSIHCSKEKGQEVNLPARLTSEINNFGPVERSPIQNLTGGLQAKWDSYD